MWVHEEEVDGRKLTEIINESHENVKYLPGAALGANVVACASLQVRRRRAARAPRRPPACTPSHAALRA
jgi:glycerol-3-phosphate dehydrogenase